MTPGQWQEAEKPGDRRPGQARHPAGRQEAARWHGPQDHQGGPSDQLTRRLRRLPFYFKRLRAGQQA